MDVIAQYGFVLSAILYAYLAVHTFAQQKGAIRHNTAFAFACLGTSAWALIVLSSDLNSHSFLHVVGETLKYSLWYYFFIQTIFASVIQKHRRLLILSINAPWIFMATSNIIRVTVPEGPTHQVAELVLHWSNIANCIIALILVEQTYRNINNREIGGARYIYFALAAIFAYDLYAVSWLYISQSSIGSLIIAKALVSIVAAGLSIHGLRQIKRTGRQLRISRHVIFYSSSLVFSGALLFAIAIAASFINTDSTDSTQVIQTLIIVIASTCLLLLASSEKLRAHSRVFINKHFFAHKYDYRERWLGLTQELSSSSNEDIYEIATLSLCKMLNSPSGELWLHDKEGQFNFKFGPEMEHTHFESPSLMSFLSSDKPTIIIDQFLTGSNIYAGLALPKHLTSRNIWIIAPLMQDKTLIGFVAPHKPQVPERLGWEDYDIIKASCLQIASHLAARQASDKLLEISQFEAYSKLTAFVMHDLKNLVAQQSLVVKNANRHKNNPEFIDDMIDTIDNSVNRMNKLLGQLKQKHENQLPETVNIKDIARNAIKHCLDRNPPPSLNVCQEDLWTTASPDELTMIFTHLIRNAQDASRESGFIDIHLEKMDNFAKITVSDNGHGMDEDFIRNRLFKPFDTTKASKGMGIGAYQVREFAQQHGGKLTVDSIADQGTTFTLTLALTAKEIT